jgi:glycosyltransferase involved in cell wall biosynthesis
MNDPPLVSVLTPSLGQGRYIRDTIESVLGQSYPRIEHIVVDGGSHDETLGVLQAYDGRVRFVSEPDGGAADAVNKAFALSRGEIVGWLNADDFYVSRDAVRHGVEALTRPGAADIVYAHALFVDESRRVLKVSLRPPFQAERLRRFDFISQPATFFRRSAVPEPPLDARLEFAFDYDLWLRLLHDGCRFERLDEIIAAMRYHPKAKSVRARPASWDESAELSIRAERPKDAPRDVAVDLGLMLAMKLRGLADFRAGRIGNGRSSVPLLLPPLPARPLYQFGLMGSKGSALLLPRYLVGHSRRARRAAGS